MERGRERKSEKLYRCKMAGDSFLNKLHPLWSFPCGESWSKCPWGSFCLQILIPDKSPRRILVLQSILHNRCCGWQWLSGQLSLPCCPPCVWLTDTQLCRGLVADWSPAFLPTKDDDYFGSKELPLPDFCVPGWLQKCYGHFPDFFLLKAVLSFLCYISFALICLRSPPLWVVKHHCLGALLSCLLWAHPAWRYWWQKAFLFCQLHKFSRWVIKVPLFVSLLGMYVEREKVRASQTEGEGGTGEAEGGRYSLLNNVKDSILFRLSLNCEVDWWNISLPYWEFSASSWYFRIPSVHAVRWLSTMSYVTG